MVGRFRYHKKMADPALREKEKERNKERMRRKRATDPEAAKARAVRERLRRYGLDHCHDTGTVRGILCQFCNFMLGNARDNINTLRAAIAYLEKY